MNESKRKSKGKKEITSKCRSNTLIDSRISVGCNYKTTIILVWKAREVKDDNIWSSEILEDRESLQIFNYSRKPKKNNYNRQSMEKSYRT